MSHSLIFKMTSGEHKTLFTARTAVQRELVLWAESALSEVAELWGRVNQTEPAHRHCKTQGDRLVTERGEAEAGTCSEASEHLL